MNKLEHYLAILNQQIGITDAMLEITRLEQRDGTLKTSDVLDLLNKLRNKLEIEKQSIK